MREYNDKYKFYYDLANRGVICVTTHKGKTIKGIAKCRKDDTFQLDTGKELAYLRCRQKLLRKKADCAADAYAKAWVAFTKAQDKLYNTVDFVNDVAEDLRSVKQALANLETSLEG